MLSFLPASHNRWVQPSVAVSILVRGTNVTIWRCFLSPNLGLQRSWQGATLGMV